MDQPSPGPRPGSFRCASRTNPDQSRVHDHLIGGVAAIVPTFAGVWIGQKVRHAASPEAFRKIFLYGMLALGLHMARGLL